MAVLYNRTPSRALSDQELMGLVVSASCPLAFAILYERHRRAALALARQICVRHVVAEEVVQEAFLALWRARRQYDSHRGELRSWLLWTVRNRAVDVLRRSVAAELALLGEAALDDPPAPDWTEQEVGRRERTREMLTVLGGLPHEQGVVIALAYYGGYTQAEIASMLDTPLGTVKGRMRLGLSKMADGLEASV